MPWDPPQRALLPDGRLHLHQGPIDLIIGADGLGREDAFRAAARRFDGVLVRLAAELPALRSDIGAAPDISEPIGRSMSAAVRPFRPEFITPMAAVAGAVADATLAAMTAVDGLDRAYVNNGGDIAVFLAPGRTFTAAIAGGAQTGRIQLQAGDGVGGIATSGWRGRSCSLGIADAVTVLAATAAAADAAATMIGNAVDLPGHAAITRTPASELYPDSDLGERLATTDVGALSATDRATALDAGVRYASRLLDRALIRGAFLQLGEDVRFVGAQSFLTFGPE